jgi:hypothetical protein
MIKRIVRSLICNGRKPLCCSNSVGRAAKFSGGVKSNVPNKGHSISDGKMVDTRLYVGIDFVHLPEPNHYALKVQRLRWE